MTSASRLKFVGSVGPVESPQVAVGSPDSIHGLVPGEMSDVAVELRRGCRTFGEM